jgi:hypothetical protein
MPESDILFHEDIAGYSFEVVQDTVQNYNPGLDYSQVFDRSTSLLTILLTCWEKGKKGGE